LIEKEPLLYPPAFEYLSGSLKNKISRRINKQHRLVYEIFEEEKLIKIYRIQSAIAHRNTDPPILPHQPPTPQTCPQPLK